MIGSPAQPHDMSDRMAALGVLAGGVAHEINNPLAYAMGNLSFAIEHLQSAAASTPELAMVLSSLRDALEGAERVRRTVRVLKMFSRPAIPTKGPMDPGRVLVAAVSMAKLWQGGRLTTDIEPLPNVMGNESSLAQVLLTLLLHATSVVDARGKVDGEVRVTARATGDEVAIEVGIASDAGEGRGTASGPTEPVAPSGLAAGLDLEWCRRIATDQSGAITIDAEGHRIKLVLPIANETPIASVAPETPRKDRRAKLLVVDDEPKIGSVIGRILGPLHDVTAVYGAEDALARLLDGEDYDVIICDLMMPHMTGADLYLALEARAPQFASRMIFMTGGPLTSPRADLLDSIDNLRIEKPFSPDALRVAVEQTIARAGDPPAR